MGYSFQRTTETSKILSSRRGSIFLPPSEARGKVPQRGNVIISVPAVPEDQQGSLPGSFSGYVKFYCNSDDLDEMIPPLPPNNIRIQPKCTDLGNKECLETLFSTRA